MGGKQNCNVLHFAGNTNRLGPINDPRTPRRKGPGTGEVPVKLCDHCGAYNHTVARVCIDCGEEFVFRVKIKPNASTQDIIRTPETSSEISIFPVTSVSKKIHTKRGGGTPTLMVQYLSNMQLFKTFLCFEHNGLPKHKAAEWWRQHCGDDVPTTVQEAYDRFGECRQAKQIKVDTAPKYPNIMEFLF